MYNIHSITNILLDPFFFFIEFGAKFSRDHLEYLKRFGV